MAAAAAAARLFACTAPNCTYETKHKRLLTDHQRSKHSDEPAVPCSVCGRLYKSLVALGAHEWRHRQPMLMCDPPCTYTAKSPQLLKEHQLTHGDARAFLCTVAGCGATFLNGSTLAAHTRKHPAPNSAARLTCALEGCTFSTTTRTAMERHARKTGHGKEFVCPDPQCGQHLPNAPALKAHVSAHAVQARRFPCSTCDFAAGDRLELVRHMNELQHADFKCPFPECGEHFRHASALSMHKRLHGGSATLTCKSCLATFLKGGEYKTHVWACSNKQRAASKGRGEAGEPAAGPEGEV